jgi:hypothetical protein
MVRKVRMGRPVQATGIIQKVEVHNEKYWRAIAIVATGLEIANQPSRLATERSALTVASDPIQQLRDCTYFSIKKS